jgi:hypothetical protein
MYALRIMYLLNHFAMCCINVNGLSTRHASTESSSKHTCVAVTLVASAKLLVTAVITAVVLSSHDHLSPTGQTNAATRTIMHISSVQQYHVLDD